MYTATLTGAASSLPDLPLPISYISASLKRTGRDYIQFVCGGALHLVDDVIARQTGEELILYHDGSEIARVNFNDFDYAEGARSGSITLSGYKQVTYSGSAQTVDTVIEYDGDFDNPTANKRLVIGWEYLGVIYPDDTVTWNGKSLTVDTLLFSLGAQGARVEIKEEP